MRFEKLCNVLLTEIFNNHMNYNPIRSTNKDNKNSLSQYFNVKNKNFKVRADMFSIPGYQNILHIEFTRVKNDGSEITNLTNDIKGYTGDIYGLIINWTYDVLNDPLFANIVDHILIIGEHDGGSFAKGQFYNKLADWFVKKHNNWKRDDELSNLIYDKLSKNDYSIIAISKIN